MGLNGHANSIPTDNIKRRSVSESNQAPCRATLLIAHCHQTQATLATTNTIRAARKHITAAIYGLSANPGRKSTSSAHPKKRWCWGPHKANSQTSGGFAPRPYTWIDIFTCTCDHIHSTQRKQRVYAAYRDNGDNFRSFTTEALFSRSNFRPKFK